LTPTPEQLADAVERVEEDLAHPSRPEVDGGGICEVYAQDLETLLAALRAKDTALIAAEDTIIGLLTTAPSEAAISAGQAWILSRAAATALGDPT